MMTGLLVLCVLALGPALVALLPQSLLPEALQVTQRESSAMHRTLSVGRCVLLALLTVAVIQQCSTLFSA